MGKVLNSIISIIVKVGCFDFLWHVSECNQISPFNRARKDQAPIVQPEFPNAWGLAATATTLLSRCGCHANGSMVRSDYPLVIGYMAMEHVHRIVRFPFKMVILHSYVSQYQKVDVTTIHYPIIPVTIAIQHAGNILFDKLSGNICIQIPYSVKVVAAFW